MVHLDLPISVVGKCKCKRIQMLSVPMCGRRTGRIVGTTTAGRTKL